MNSITLISESSVANISNKVFQCKFEKGRTYSDTVPLSSGFYYFGFSGIPNIKFSYGIYKTLLPIMDRMIIEKKSYEPISFLKKSLSRQRPEIIIESIEYNGVFENKNKIFSDENFSLNIYNIITEEKIVVRCADKYKIYHFSLKDKYESKRPNREKIEAKPMQRCIEQGLITTSDNNTENEIKSYCGEFAISYLGRKTSKDVPRSESSSYSQFKNFSPLISDNRYCNKCLNEMKKMLRNKNIKKNVNIQITKENEWIVKTIIFNGVHVPNIEYTDKFFSLIMFNINTKEKVKVNCNEKYRIYHEEYKIVSRERYIKNREKMKKYLAREVTYHEKKNFQSDVSKMIEIIKDNVTNTKSTLDEKYEKAKKDLENIIAKLSEIKLEKEKLEEEKNKLEIIIGYFE